MALCDQTTVVICLILFCICFMCMRRARARTEPLTSLNKVVVSDASGNLVTANVAQSMMYCDGGVCTQPYPSVLKVGQWTFEEEAATGHLIMRRNGAADEADKPFIRFATDGNIAVNRSTYKGWLADNFQAVQNSSVQVGTTVWLNNLKDSGNAYISRQDENVFKASANKDSWEKFKIEK